jgi:hypothetical protein
MYNKTRSMKAGETNGKNGDQKPGGAPASTQFAIGMATPRRSTTEET